MRRVQAILTSCLLSAIMLSAVISAAALAQAPPGPPKQSPTAPAMPRPPASAQTGLAEVLGQVFQLGTMTGQQFQVRIGEMQTRIDGLEHELADVKAKCGDRCPGEAPK